MSRVLLLSIVVVFGCAGRGESVAARDGGPTSDAGPVDASTPDAALDPDAPASDVVQTRDLVPSAETVPRDASAPLDTYVSGDVSIDRDAGASDTAASDTALSDRPPDMAPADPACSGADQNGLFGSCGACKDRNNCETITVGGRTRYACGCTNSGDCPCNLRCGSYQIAPGISVSNVCVR